MRLEQEGFNLEVDEVKEPKYKEGYVKPYSDLTHRAKGFKNIISKVFKHKIKNAIDKGDYNAANTFMQEYIKKLRPLVEKTQKEPNAKAFYILQQEFKNTLELFGYYIDGNGRELVEV